MRPGIAIVLAALVAACGSTSSPRPATTDEPTPGADTITAADLRAHVALLASDAYRGRETLEPGYDMAADHLADQFGAYGLQPLPGASSFRLGYPLYKLGFDAPTTALSIVRDGNASAVEAGIDFTPFTFSDSGTHTAEVVFAGYGITAPKLDYDDYANIDAAGKLVLVLRHTPNEDKDGAGFSRMHAAFASKAANARKHGAVGMLVVTDPRHHDGSEDDLRLATRLAVDPPAKPSPAAQAARKPAEQDQPFVALHISQSAAAQLLPAGSPSLVDIQTAVDGGAPASTFSLGAVRATATVSRTETPTRVVADNVVGVLPGADPARADEWIVVGAHYDHLGVVAGGGDGDTVYNGADDNASGTAGLLELAQAFAGLPTRPARSIVFVGFSGEEKGLLGSRAIVQSGQLPRDKLVFMLNLDMIGRNPDQPVSVVGDGYADGIRAAVEAANASVALPIRFGGDSYSGASDHHPFYAARVPFLFFFTGLHDDYHQLSDHVDRVEYDRMEQIVRVAYGTLAAVASAQVTPAFVHHVAWLGSKVRVKDGAATVVSVEPGSRGAGAGLRAGDVIARVGDAPLADANQIGARLDGIESGAATTLTVTRADTAVQVHVTRVEPGYLGVTPRRVTDERRTALSLTNDTGFAIGNVSAGGPAASAGVVSGDIVIQLGDAPVALDSLGGHLARIGAGETVEIVVIRGDERVELQVTLGKRPQRRR